MLHFSCTSSNDESATERWTADSCALAPDLTQAEKMARQLIQQHHYEAKELIAFSEINEQDIASLSELESTLYLKAQAGSGRCAVMFSN